MLALVPATPDHDTVGLHDELDVGEVGMFVDGPAEDDCALCQIGCCVQRYVYGGPDCDEPLLIHGTLGTC